MLPVVGHTVHVGFLSDHQAPTKSPLKKPLLGLNLNLKLHTTAQLERRISFLFYLLMCMWVGQLCRPPVSLCSNYVADKRAHCQLLIPENRTKAGSLPRLRGPGR
jgi:hypothetical protein